MKKILFLICTLAVLSFSASKNYFVNLCNYNNDCYSVDLTDVKYYETMEYKPNDKFIRFYFIDNKIMDINLHNLTATVKRR